MAETVRQNQCPGQGWPCFADAPPSGEVDGMRSRAAHRPVRRRGKAPAPVAVPAIVNRVLSRPGESLDAATRAHFEPRFGHDFSRVRIHSDAEAGRSAAAVGADAYAFGQDIAFATSRHAPATAAGRALLAHELAHVVQQPEAVSPARLVGDASGTAERQADGMAAAALSGVPSTIGRRVAPTGALHRWPTRGFGDPDPSRAFDVSMANGSTFSGFASDGVELTEDHRSQIAAFKRKITKLLAVSPESRLTIVGHIDADDTEAQKKHLGQRRADAVMAALGTGDAALPAGMMEASSVSETGAEARVEVHLRQLQPGMPPRIDFSKPPPGADTRTVPSPHARIPLTPPSDWASYPRTDANPEARPFTRTVPGLPSPYAKTPTRQACKNNWVAEAFESLIKKLPESLQKKASAAVGSLDEIALQGLVSLGPEGDYQAPLKAVVKTGLQYIKCKKADMKEPSLISRIAPAAPDLGKAPGQRIFEILKLKF
jgi:outer membrane protein OmpA-like peptidoglycan-associated protein